jgi:hypothetical protein
MCLQDWFNHKNVSCSRRLRKWYFEKHLLIFIKRSTCEYVTCSCIIGMSWMACCITILTLSLWPKLRQSKVCKLKSKFEAWDKLTELKHIFTQNVKHVGVQWCHLVSKWTRVWIGKHEQMEYSFTYFFMFKNIPWWCGHCHAFQG